MYLDEGFIGFPDLSNYIHYIGICVKNILKAGLRLSTPSFPPTGNEVYMTGRRLYPVQSKQQYIELSWRWNGFIK